MAEGGRREDEFMGDLERSVRWLNTRHRFQNRTSNAEHFSTRRSFRQYVSRPIHKFAEQIHDERSAGGASAQVRGFRRNVSGPINGNAEQVPEHRSAGGARAHSRGSRQNVSRPVGKVPKHRSAGGTRAHARGDRGNVSGPIYENAEQVPEHRSAGRARAHDRGSEQNVSTERSGPIYEFAKQVPEDRPSHGARAHRSEHIHEEIQDVYEVAQEVEQLNISDDLRDDSELWRTADKRITKSKFESAILLIKDFPPTQRQQLLMSECYLQLDKMRDAKKCIRSMETLVISHSSSGYVEKLIREYISAESYIRALLLLSCLSKMYKVKSDPNEAVKGIKSCSKKCGCKVIPKIIKRGGRLRDIAIDLGLQMINDMLTDSKSVTGSYSSIKAECESWCLNHIAHCYFALENYQKSLELRHQGLDIMKKQFGSHVSKYQVFGCLLHNIGIDHGKLGNYSDAYAYFTQALEVYEVVEDWNNDNKKQREIANTHKNQIRVQKLLKK